MFSSKVSINTLYFRLCGANGQDVMFPGPRRRHLVFNECLDFPFAAEAVCNKILVMLCIISSQEIIKILLMHLKFACSCGQQPHIRILYFQFFLKTEPIPNKT